MEIENNNDIVNGLKELMANCEQFSFKGKLISKITMKRTDILCNNNGVILQLWYDIYSDYKEWRPLESFEEASKKLGTSIICKG